MIAFAMSAVIAPATSRSEVVTGFPCLLYATMILPMRSRMSARSFATARIAIISEDTVMAKPLFIM